MNNSAIIMFLFGAIILWGGSIYFLWKLLRRHKKRSSKDNTNNNTNNNTRHIK
ncbi:MetS family NSS transporter small subunit [Methanococcus aeolicus]|uniref:MetS family NSS transporter small subunit n=1 Tax=Methanococcus aeolicus TaxID=42879 RepID=UPI000AF12BF1|nr:MetS family NSS transporter small subunit [Methanococcus aeolicus]UXM84793.1 MetS family NSS transporter small subunit [Methanococcus aeolicus]